MDRDRNGEIDTFDFLDMREILQLRMHPFHEYMLPHNRIKRFGSRIFGWRHFQNIMVSSEGVGSVACMQQRVGSFVLM